MNTKELFKKAIKEEIVKASVKQIIRHELKESKREITSILKDKSGKDAR